MVDLLKEKNLGLSIETNGTLVTPELAKYLIEKSTLYHVSISLDGADSESHDKFRGVKGAFDKACEGVRAFVEVGYRPQVIMSLYTGNVNEIEALVQLSEAMGAGSVKFNIVQPSGRGEQMTKRGQLLDIQRLIETGKWIESDLQKRTSIQLYYSWPMAFHGLRRLLDKGADACGIFNILGILSNGQLAMCGIGMEIPELCFGQIGVDPITDVWCNHPTLKKLRHSLPGELEGVCGNCVFRYQCLGSCVAENYHQTRRLTAPFWFCQQAKQAGLFPIERLREGMYNQV
jgi:SynChlorMet cassette radical SAM/SPASM protein ScmF